ncbi:5-formyltetrahydrofolate cyclo-ligase [Cellulophaga sp. HaHa_2_95]|uniref:5-formyltetrahydrofolate cyclo-ligase n=1 Tax=unclassified Cellulophaga TaxID=2634405 RepID=UPI001C4F0D89|nr:MULTISPECIES: 5-formyltetrahydrofolate cyclo-ligase [unclassified Cellulophaga]QXP50830.1 5-formyltetrahydrofolate cyclo-ligase [Cellulophaga sp. HaHa_2_1]QXP56841.1 5-formyltetrahydrofolate cyclo-ligase [Cellulophaga sp. HaHa_2_95]
MIKKDLRLTYTSRREKLSPDELIDSSISIANNLLQLPIWNKNNYHLYLSISEKKEIDTSFILSILQGKDKNIILSKMQDSQTLQHYLLTDNTLIKKNKWNVPEPVDGIEIPANSIDVVFIPLLAFDALGNRVGYGKGYYDKFLADCNENCLKVGLSFFEAADTITDILATDIKLDYCVTPNKTYTF